MHDLKTLIEQLRNDFKNEIKPIQTMADLEHFRIRYLGRNGTLASAMARMKDLPVEDKKIVAPLLNELKKWMEHE